MAFPLYSRALLKVSMFGLSDPFSGSARALFRDRPQITFSLPVFIAGPSRDSGRIVVQSISITVGAGSQGETARDVKKAFDPRLGDIAGPYGSTDLNPLLVWTRVR
jgi:hypothetical protein